MMRIGENVQTQSIFPEVLDRKSIDFLLEWGRLEISYEKLKNEHRLNGSSHLSSYSGLSEMIARSGQDTFNLGTNIVLQGGSSRTGRLREVL